LGDRFEGFDQIPRLFKGDKGIPPFLAMALNPRFHRAIGGICGCQIKGALIRIHFCRQTNGSVFRKARLATFYAANVENFVGHITELLEGAT
jgi:hypothetical protein